VRVFKAQRKNPDEPNFAALKIFISEAVSDSLGFAGRVPCPTCAVEWLTTNQRELRKS